MRFAHKIVSITLLLLVFDINLEVVSALRLCKMLWHHQNNSCAMCDLFDSRSGATRYGKKIQELSINSSLACCALKAANVEGMNLISAPLTTKNSFQKIKGNYRHITSHCNSSVSTNLPLTDQSLSSQGLKIDSIKNIFLLNSSLLI